ncbi:TonB-dependent Receptor Plug Domain [Pseudidiomarina maritima]|uniref:TonB-dependent Receptor Plug Domain n=1 Tax=Pseudidiomarina maritima TaxID=519453 RepID=A0A1I6GR41_9GAMM|nr:TonB-dependent receptor [Pseudidiomarina maritima]SFR44579.1 TonB-dependent Receptor Plug Domain [Pseudidiomarina maritima]
MKSTFFRSTLAAAAVASALGVAAPAMAQDNSKGYLQGQSTDQSGQVVSEVTVTITNLETGLTRSSTTNESGNFRFPLLPPGAYSLKAEKSGYGTVAEERVNVGVAGTTTINLTMATADAMETLTVRGSSVSMIDTTSSESQLVVTQDFLEKVPVPRDIASVALLAPGTTKGDSSFGNLTSFGGASVGENVYYVNGLNVTNFRNGLGGAELPFEMYETFEVKTGGYSAEYGRSTGGVVNATTKSGSNEFEAGFSAYFEPDSLRENAPDTIVTDPNAIAELGGYEYYGLNHNDKISETNYNLWASGALVQDKLFFFGLVNFKDRTSDYTGNTLAYDRDGSDVLYALKLDWYITPDHILEFTGWDNSSDLDTSKYGFDSRTETRGELFGDYVLERGGQSYAVQYTGIVSDDITISALYGVNKATYSNVNAANTPVGAVHYPSGRQFTQFGLNTPSVMEDERKAYRFDVDWYVSMDHTLRFGIDYEDMSAIEETARVGNTLYQYQDCANMDAVTEGDLLNADCARVRFNTYVNSGSFQTKSSAFYVQDTWNVTDTITARIGLRNETFENYNKAGEKFVDVTDQWAPRIGLAWDVFGDGETKAFANYGRYFLPVATNTNIRLAGDELYTIYIYDVLGINDDLSPIVDEDAILGGAVYADGTLKGTGETVDADFDPMYQDEFILGFEQVLSDNWSMGVKATYRDLKSSLEDIAIDYGFNEYLEAEFGSSCTACSGFHYYVLTNPGDDVTVTTDPDYDGPLEYGQYTIPGSYLGYPEAKRQYAAVDFNIRRAFADNWMVDATYTWSHSWGNNEGFVRSDNGQTDAGLTTNFDQPGLTDGAYGNLPNDRRHMLKVQSAYQFTEALTLGANFRWETGRPLSAFGLHGTDVFASWYGAESFYKGGELVPRGSVGRTDNNWSLDLTARYELNVNDIPVVLRADVFNVFNNDAVTERNEVAEYWDGGANPNGTDSAAESYLYNLPDAYQTPRYFRFSVDVRF